MKRFAYIIIFLVLAPFFLSAQIPDKPFPPKLVNDLAGVLSSGQISNLEDMLVKFDNETSTQVTVVTVPSLNGYDKADFAFRIGEKWGVGREGKNNGVVVLVKPKVKSEKGEVYIAVGYGLEGVIPDAVANRLIVNQEMIPRFKEDDYYGGISAGVKVITDLAKGEFTAEQYAQNSAEPMGGGGAVFILLFFIIIIAITLSRKSNRVHSAGSRDLPLWVLLNLMNQGKKHSGGWGDFSSGRGTFGGGSFGGRGGFGGFGGGRFGGGGAGGSW